MLYITILGTGSTVFARQLITDILQIERLDEGCFALVDIDPVRLELAHQIAERLVTTEILRTECCFNRPEGIERALAHGFPSSKSLSLGLLAGLATAIGR